MEVLEFSKGAVHTYQAGTVVIQDLYTPRGL